MQESQLNYWQLRFVNKEKEGNLMEQYPLLIYPIGFEFDPESYALKLFHSKLKSGHVSIFALVVALDEAFPIVPSFIVTQPKGKYEFKDVLISPVLGESIVPLTTSYV